MLGDTIIANHNELSMILCAGVIILALFIVLRFFKTIFSMSFVGFLMSLFSYFVYDYIFIKFPVIACVALLMCTIGFSKTNLIGKVFSFLGTLLSAYIIIHTLGFI